MGSPVTLRLSRAIARLKGSRSETQARAALFIVFFASYAYFYQAGGWNQNTRFDLVRAITNERSLAIDPFHANTGDKAFFEGHYYSDKAPGNALTAVPIIAITRPIMRAFGGDPESYGGIALLSYLATALTVGLVTALAAVGLFNLSLELGATFGGALFAALTFGLATPIWTLATIFIGHAFSAALLVFAFAAACRIGSDTHVRPTDAVRYGLLVGLCAGWATVSEFPAAVPAVLLAGLAAVNAWPLGRQRMTRVVLALAVGALACAAVLMAYQYACFGSPFHLAYSSEQGYAGMQQGVFGVDVPRVVRLRRILFGSYRGLLPLAPVLALAPVGLVLMMVRLKADTTRMVRRPAPRSAEGKPPFDAALGPENALQESQGPLVAQAFREREQITVNAETAETAEKNPENSLRALRLPGRSSGTVNRAKAGALRSNVVFFHRLFRRANGPPAALKGCTTFSFATTTGHARRAAIVASIIAVYYILLNAGYSYWEGGWSFGPRHLSPGLPFLCLGLGALWTLAPRGGRVVLAALSTWGAAVSLIAVATMAQPPAQIRRPLADFLIPAFREGDLALNTQRFTDGGADPVTMRDHTEPKAAWNLGMKLGLRGHASLVPLGIVWLACAGWLIAGAAERRRPSPHAEAASQSTG